LLLLLLLLAAAAAAAAAHEQIPCRINPAPSRIFLDAL
jgi:hypothetical protein